MTDLTSRAWFTGAAAGFSDDDGSWCDFTLDDAPAFEVSFLVPADALEAIRKLLGTHGELAFTKGVPNNV